MAYSSQDIWSMNNGPSYLFNALQMFLDRTNANNQQQQMHPQSFSLPLAGYQHVGINGGTNLVGYYVNLFPTRIQEQYIQPININLDVDTNQGYPSIEANDSLMRELLNQIMMFRSQLNGQQVNQVSQPLVTDQDKTVVRNKEYRCDKRGRIISGEIIRIQKRAMECRRDICVFGPAFVSAYESLVLSSEEIAKQSKLIISLNKVICTEWPRAKLHVYGSCANSFGMVNCNVDLCLSVDTCWTKREIIPKLAKILEASGLRIVQSLPRARVPIVKMMDPETGISFNICSNNLLAIVNTKLLNDYAMIDARLRQLAIIVKHWAKSRRVNETYQGTLSSYAYVIMCIHYLQIRQPTILPCLQKMETTYVTTIDNKIYGYHDKVENFHGARNIGSIARLVWGFFHYWAYQHDYTSDVISIRTGSVINKHEKDWIKPRGLDEHLICIEDPFDTTHDLGRVVDKSTIKILREEFERAANIMQYDPNPIEALFEKYDPPPKVEDDLGDQGLGWGSTSSY